jgi:hypothetical protein
MWLAMEYQSVPGHLGASGEHKPSALPKSLIIAFGAIFLILAFVCLAAAIGTHLVAPAIVGIAIGAPGVVCLYVVFRAPRELRSKWSYSVRPQGLVRREDGLETLVIWENMAEVFFYPSQFEGEALSVYRVVTTAHEEIRITSSTGNHDAIGRAIVNEANRRYLETAEVLLNGGGKVEFGDLWISRTHFGFERKSLLWQALSAVRFENVSGTTRVMFIAALPKSNLPFCSVQAYSIPYLRTFVELLRRMPVRLENPIDI